MYNLFVKFFELICVVVWAFGLICICLGIFFFIQPSTSKDFGGLKFIFSGLKYFPGWSYIYIYIYIALPLTKTSFIWDVSQVYHDSKPSNENIACPYRHTC